MLSGRIFVFFFRAFTFKISSHDNKKLISIFDIVNFYYPHLLITFKGSLTLSDTKSLGYKDACKLWDKEVKISKYNNEIAKESAK